MSNQEGDGRQNRSSLGYGSHDARQYRGGFRSESKDVDRIKLESAIRNVFMRREHLSASGWTSEKKSVEGTIHFRQFMSALLENNPKYFRATLDRLHSERVSLLVICETLVIPIAEELGRMWSDDRETFSTISAATSRLHLLLSTLSDRNGPASTRDAPRSILLMRTPGNDHTLGLSVIAACFRDEGWGVDGGPELPAGTDAYRMIRNNQYSLIGISAGIDVAPDDIRDILANVRQAYGDGSPNIFLGGPTLSERQAELNELGPVKIANDVRQAIAIANSACSGASG